MSLKVLCFGENQFLKRVIGKLKNQHRESNEDEIIVDNIDIKGRPFLTFSISNPELIGSQATGTSGLIYFLDPSIPLYEQKQFFFNVISERKQFEGIPAVIVYDKDQKLNIKQIVNYFELFKVKDRASMIKEVDLDQKDTITEIFGWIDNQIQFRRTRTFDAPPKIVKMKPKYRESEPESNEKKYENIVKDKKFRNLGVKSQEQAYIQMEKQRIKNQNMEKQLANFNKNKKKMAPYDIKATPNPKIDANLHFFLKDARVQKAQQVNIKIQTDEFKQKPKQKPYIPKKTGVNIATQIEPTQLFDFVKEVQPILDILTTRALEAAALEIEQEEQILKIAKYKNAYTDRVKTQKKHEQEKIEQQMQAIRDKERILQAARKKDQNKKTVTKKQSYYSIANTFLQNIYKDSAISLYNKNFYPNEFEHALKIDYLPEVLRRSLLSYQKMIENEKCLQNVFEGRCVQPVQKQSKQLRQQQKNKKKQSQARRINKGDSTRFVHIYYDSDEPQKFTSFAKYLSKQLDGNLDEYIKSREDEIQQAQDKHQAGQLPQSQVLLAKDKDNSTYAQNHNSVFLQNQKNICFEATQNKYSPPQKSENFVPSCLIFDRQGNLLQNLNIFSKAQAYARGVTNLRVKRDLVNFDNGLIINPSQLPPNVRSIVFYLKINKASSYLGETQIKNIKNSAYQLEFYDKAIPIFKQDIGADIKWEQLQKPIEGGDGGDETKANQKTNKSLYIWAYHLINKRKQSWQIQQLNIPSKLIEEENQHQFIEKVIAFYKHSLDIFKTEEEEPKQSPKASSRNAKRKSKKSIASEKQFAPKPIPKLTSRILKQVEINLRNNWQQIFNKLGDSVVDWKDFIQNSSDGWFLEFRGKKLQNNEQIKKYNKVGDIILRKVIPVVEEEEQKPEVVEGENQEKQEQS